MKTHNLLSHKIFTSFLVLFLSFIYCIAIHGQIHFSETNNYTSNLELETIFRQAIEIRDSFVKIKINVKRYDILEIENKKYLLPDGRFDVFEWNGYRWSNLYQKNFSGYNNNSKKFVFQGNIYSFGGYGYWRIHGDLIKFIKYKGEWEMVPYKVKEPIGNGISFLKNSFLYILNPEKHIDGYPDENIGVNSLRIDLKTLKTESINFNFKVNSKDRIETENFIVFTGKPTEIIDKKNLKLYHNDLKGFDCLYKTLTLIDNGLLFYSKNDSLLVFDKDFNKICKTDVNSEIKNFDKEVNSFNLQAIIIGLILLGSALLISFIIYKRRKKYFTLKNNIDKFNVPEIEKFLAYSGKTITIEELDVILGIEKIRNAETQRFKRSKMINAINQETRIKTGTELIHRIPDPEDKRRFLYEVKGLK